MIHHHPVPAGDLHEFFVVRRVTALLAHTFENTSAWYSSIQWLPTLSCLGKSTHSKLMLCYAGSLDVPSSAMELDLAKAGMHMLIEKPISMRPEEEVGRLGKVGTFLIAALLTVNLSKHNGNVTPTEDDLAKGA